MFYTRTIQPQGVTRTFYEFDKNNYESRKMYPFEKSPEIKL